MRKKNIASPYFFICKRVEFFINDTTCHAIHDIYHLLYIMHIKYNKKY